HGRVAGLDDEDVGPPDRLEVAHVRLAVREGLQLDLAERDPELVGDLQSEVGVRAAGEEHQALLGTALAPRLALLGRQARPDRLETRKCRLSHLAPASSGRSL